ncbi:hypothetical protein [Gluconobacter potus]|nr:hypothetical protein [Gluconobacter potus]
MPTVPRAVQKGVEDGAIRIRKATQAQLGQYLDGPEPGLPTAPLADSTINERIRLGFTPDDPGVRTGDMRESYGERVSGPGMKVAASIGSDDIKAVVFEVGRLEQGNYQPPRPELAVAAARNEDKVAHGVARVLVRTLCGRPLPNIPDDENTTP